MSLLDETKRGIIPTLDYFSEIVDNFYFVNAPLFLLFLLGSQCRYQTPLFW